ncbi:MAG: hypothetical protein H6983_14055 [Ectothiorhodospiraceae bacterium]|nr:hypothetical protein [Ectothiorhodospiraceae bacterium]
MRNPQPSTPRRPSRLAHLRPHLAGLALFVACAAAQAAGIPPTGALEFTVLRNGSEVGHHSVVFSHQGDRVDVAVRTSVNVKIPLVGISVYHFEHEGRESWRDGSLVALTSTTDDDGTAHSLDVRRESEGLVVRSDVTEHTSGPGAIPASLWNPALVQQTALLNTLDGTMMPVTVADLGAESITVHGQPVQARHYAVSGGLARDVWYDSAGVLVQVRFKAKDDSDIQYVLR